MANRARKTYIYFVMATFVVLLLALLVALAQACG